MAAEARLRGVKAMKVEADLANEREVETIIPRVAEHLGEVSLLVNNASVFEMDKAETATRASWDKHIEVNLRAPFVLAQAFAKALPAEMQGAIVNVTSVAGLQGHGSSIPYAASKAALNCLTQSLARAFAPQVRVNAVAPGPVLTRWLAGHMDQVERMCDSISSRLTPRAAQSCSL